MTAFTVAKMMSTPRKKDAPVVVRTAKAEMFIVEAMPAKSDESL